MVSYSSLAGHAGCSVASLPPSSQTVRRHTRASYFQRRYASWRSIIRASIHVCTSEKYRSPLALIRCALSMLATVRSMRARVMTPYNLRSRRVTNTSLMPGREASSGDRWSPPTSLFLNIVQPMRVQRRSYRHQSLSRPAVTNPALTSQRWRRGGESRRKP